MPEFSTPAALALPVRRIARRALALALAALAPLAAAHAQTWPAQPLKAIVPFGPGSSPDQVARIVGEKAGAILGQAIVIENKPGASGNIGTYAIANAKPDGYTFGVSITGPLVNNTLLFDKLPYAPATDLSPLTLAVHQPNVLVVPAAAGIGSVGQLLQALKQNPDKYNFPSPGAGTVSHLAVELMLQQIGARATHVPYPSSPAALSSLLSGDTQFAALPPIAVMPMVKDGRLKALAVTSSKRSALLPDIPTLAEAGVPDIEGSAWIGFVISSRAPADVRKKLSDALIQAVRDPEVAKRLQAQFMDPVGDTPAEFRAYMDDELNRWAPLIRKLGIKAQ
ncbi:ABC transporter substrate-binding protein [Achromobacter sp. HZ01]|uniref:Bug family tripartite tricarboxylate transporter substrate binding protein n=1 Tax=Achromobacter sp. HZ01 TaxID=1416886 RepID=UPI000DC4AA07|nr:tripartite tricarboxylate transporter substrate binding protein [Achromobacter sp. HZ01]RAP63372.1 ABC transporter substrate-binding protein [Achromobacter sp. HZ01]